MLNPIDQIRQLWYPDSIVFHPFPLLNSTRHSRVYTHRFFIGTKVQIGIPLSNSKTFYEWGIVNEIDEDLIAIQLSRDTLPTGVSLRVGQQLSVNTKSQGEDYSYQTLLVSKGYEQDLLLRIISETEADVEREFYRIDAFLPIKFTTLTEQDPAKVKQYWELQLKARLYRKRIKERERADALLNRVLTEENNIEQVPSDNDSLNSTIDDAANSTVEDIPAEFWESAITAAVNISGGGLKIHNTPKFQASEFIMLEIYVPSVQRIVEVIARVVCSEYNDKIKDDKNHFTTSMQFVHMEEIGRFAVNNHICGIQLKRLRSFKGYEDVVLLTRDNINMEDKHLAYLEDDSRMEVPSRFSPKIIRRFVKQFLVGTIVIYLCYLTYSYFDNYIVRRPKNEIENLFNNAIKSTLPH